MRPRSTALRLTAALVVVVVAAGCQSGSSVKDESKLAVERNEAAPLRSLREVDGGPAFLGNFTNPLPAASTYFPLGVWLESIHTADDVRSDSEAGINLYVGLTPDSELGLLTGSGPYVISAYPSAEDNGAVLADEPDMWAGPGNAAWTGNWPGQGPICQPDQGRCGYTLQRQVAAGVDSSKITYSNYGKGITFWQSDEESAVFINEFQDIASADNYWFTDPNICGQGEGGALVDGERPLAEPECRLAANYGWTVDRVRSLVRPSASRPVWGFVELGQPFDAPTKAASGPQIRAAVWSSIIHGARGIVYFNHSFGGDCRSFHLLREPCAQGIRSDVKTLNRQVAELAPVLNAPFLDGAIKHSTTVHSAVKILDDSLYILTGSAQAAAQEAFFELPCLAKGGGTVTVLNEDRTVSMDKGAFRDSFDDGNAVHLYRIEGAAALCKP